MINPATMLALALFIVAIAVFAAADGALKALGLLPLGMGCVAAYYAAFPSPVEYVNPRLTPIPDGAVFHDDWGTGSLTDDPVEIRRRQRVWDKLATKTGNSKF